MTTETKTYVLHGMHLEERGFDAIFVAAIAGTPERLVEWLGEQFRKESAELVDEGEDPLPAELLDPKFGVVFDGSEMGGEVPLTWVFEPEWPYMWEITEAPSV